MGLNLHLNRFLILTPNEAERRFNLSLAVSCNVQTIASYAHGHMSFRLVVHAAFTLAPCCPE